MGTRRPLNRERERPTQNARIPFRSTFGFAVNGTTTAVLHTSLYAHSQFLGLLIGEAERL